MKKLRLLSLVGITSIALTHAAWAGPHGGGGGGFGGGGFSGGGHVGGGGGRAGPVGGGGGFRGGGFHAAGPAFGGARRSFGVERAEAELASAYRATLHWERVRHIGSLSIIMDELANP